MADPGHGGGQDWPPGPPPSAPPPTVPFVVPPPPPGRPPPSAGYPPYPPVHPAVYGPVVMEAPKSKLGAAALAFFLGVFGIHNFYLGRNALGVAQVLLATIGGILTCGLATVAVLIWSFVECIMILCGAIPDRYGRPLV